MEGITNWLVSNQQGQGPWHRLNQALVDNFSWPVILSALCCAGPSRQHPAGHAEARLTAPAAALPSSPAATSLHQSAPELRLPHTFSHITLEELRATTEKFAAEREWEKFHSPRNLLLALVSMKQQPRQCTCPTPAHPFPRFNMPFLFAFTCKLQYIWSHTSLVHAVGVTVDTPFLLVASQHLHQVLLLACPCRSNRAAQGLVSSSSMPGY